ncbi:hypothetical protein PI124_g6274 [Phytophthora idaei]|nr:hypothetical protein PI124_g6274 [Phytophthora idaei]
MRRWFKVFPEVMSVDATHNTNESRYKLFSFMITDVGQMRFDGADAELKKLACEVSPYAYRLIEQQYWSSKDRKTHYEVEELHPSLFVLTGDDPTSAYHVDTSRYHCSCVLCEQCFYHVATSCIGVW